MLRFLPRRMPLKWKGTKVNPSPTTMFSPTHPTPPPQRKQEGRQGNFPPLEQNTTGRQSTPAGNTGNKKNKENKKKKNRGPVSSLPRSKSADPICFLDPPDPIRRFAHSPDPIRAPGAAMYWTGCTKGTTGCSSEFSVWNLRGRPAKAKESNEGGEPPFGSPSKPFCSPSEPVFSSPSLLFQPFNEFAGEKEWEPNKKTLPRG